MGTFDFKIRIVIGKYENAGKYAEHIYELEKGDSMLYGDDISSPPLGRCFHRDGYIPIIWLPKKPRTPREFATLSHEVLHAVLHIFRWACIPLTEDTEEVLCHALAHVLNKILTQLRRK